MIRRLFFFLLVMLLPALSGRAAGASVGSDMVREAEIEQQLQRIDPSLVEPFRNARIAMDKNDYAETERLLTPVCQSAPAFAPALRRLGSAMDQLGKRQPGLVLLEQAVALERSSANLSSLGGALAFPGGDKKSSAKEQERAFSLLLECRELPDGQDAGTLSMTAQLALQLNHPGEARAATRLLEQKFPDLMQTHYFAAFIAAGDERWGRAEKEIRAAEKLGLDPKAVQSFLDAGIQSRATGWRVAGITAWAIGLWAAGLALLCGLGFALSKATLRQVEHSDPSVPIAPAEHRLRRIYRWVLNMAGVYYYISLPVVTVIVIAVAAGLIFAFMAIGYLPIKLILILGIGAVVTIWTLGRSLFLRVKASDPGRPLARSEAEGLWQLTEEVAKTLETRPIDEIRITLGTDLCVYERGTWREKLENKAKRVLVIGAAVLNGFKQQDFRSVLAHEYGHFSNRDTAGGDVAMRVQNDMLKFYYAMLEAGQATWLNVAFHFLRMYNFIFRRISRGATRLQEVLADRVAAQTYGASAFEGGLRHVIRQSIEFDARANLEIKDAIRASRPIQNLYEPRPSDATSVQEEFEKAINRPATADDTHPGPKDRFRLIAKLPEPSRPASTGLVWDLFKDRDAITREMMEKLEKDIAAHR